MNVKGVKKTFRDVRQEEARGIKQGHERAAVEKLKEEENAITEVATDEFVVRNVMRWREKYAQAQLRNAGRKVEEK